MKKLIEKNVAEIIVITLLTIVFSSCSSTRNLQEVVNTSEDMIEWINHDVESGYLDSTRADSYIENLEQIINEVR